MSIDGLWDDLRDECWPGDIVSRAYVVAVHDLPGVLLGAFVIWAEKPMTRGICPSVQ